MHAQQELVDVEWAQMLHVCALGLVSVGGVVVHDSKKLNLSRQELKFPARHTFEIESIGVM